ncbi:type IV pilin-like G/H family protein [Nodularia spumigena CS-591/12]|uniref:type IV pilin-like G/H family protein n=1 Tax=Nodularia spumigena TaxID=70799 RepID=UPI00232DC6EF|nr:type IV pilin-like G/H family protein [Nodularia spumigena]MDB9306653.1 type IV pilin-like G/H family protein [Nodularia spumigena CS-591/12]
MKTELKAKFLQHILNKKKDESGFTLIELLVVIIIIGILSAIALPSFLNQAAKARQSEAKSFVGAVNRAQQAYRIENTTFGGTYEDLEIGLPTLTENYEYTLQPAGVDAGVASGTAVLATPIDVSALKGFSGGVAVLESGQTSSAACQTTGVQEQTNVVVPTLTVTDPAACGTDMEPMK